MSNFIDLFDIPKEYISRTSKITITGFNEILIENFKSILEYENFFIRIETYDGIININGFNLILNQMNDENIILNGKISSIDFEKGVKF